jgi:putative transcriptional regulator
MMLKLKAGALALLALSLALPLYAQAPAKGRLLVATPDLQDPDYRESVVLLLHHDENGTIGVTINRPTWLEPRAVVPELEDLDGYDGRVFRGGPLAPTQLIYLVRDPPPGAFDVPPITRDIYASGNFQLIHDLVALGGGQQRIRLYAGHAEWAAGQLEQEVADGQWVVTEASVERIFSTAPAGLWTEILAHASEIIVRNDGGGAGSAELAPLAKHGEPLLDPTPRQPLASVDPR